MTTQRARVGATRVVLGEDWVEAGQDGQDIWWEALRTKWHRDLVAGGWQLCDDPEETTLYDERLGHAILHIRAIAWREVDLVGPPAGRDRFA